ncbi:MAG: CHAT domain-containing protein [Calothrix sp. C42_A2020_038]|nr:CHAT domain-containing protein [Calothrix sp. C42_A2020_038]
MPFLFRFNKSILRFLVITVCTVILSVKLLPALANITTVKNEESQSQIEQTGKALYDSGRYAEAAQVLQKSVEEYKQQGKIIEQAVALGNLSLTHQQLGNWKKAIDAITQSLDLQGYKKFSQNNINLPVLAQTLDIQGRLQLAIGRPEQAFLIWKQTEEIYTKLKDKNSIVISRLGQAQALRSQGFNRRAVELLEQINQTLKPQPDSLEKATALLSLGNTLQSVGKLEESNHVLQQSLEIAQRLKFNIHTASSLLSLGNNARAQGKVSEAISFYQQTQRVSPSPLTKVQAQINQYSLLIETQNYSQAQSLIPTIQTQLEQIPPSRASIYARINFANFLPHNISFSLLATAIQQSRSIGDVRAEAYALGKLGNLYEKTQQLQQARELTEKALMLAKETNSAEIAYLWQWQLGRILKSQGNIKAATTAYDAAINSLEELRTDLVAINQDVQFNFRDNVEPVYRESVALLLSEEKPSQKTLEQARERIEALQLAEIDNFFREACLEGQRVVLDKVVDKENPTAAIIYPIILPEQLQVIIKIPQKQLRHHTIKKSQTEVEAILQQIREYIIEPDRAEDVQTISQEVYNWLIKPIESELTSSKINTLVFVLDGALRNVPMAALYDGEKYLVEKYAIALSLGLQLFQPKPLAQTKLNVLAGGLVQPPLDYQKQFPPLPEIKSEFNLISQAGVSTTQLLDQKFNSKNLETKVNTSGYNVLHLATHGQFSSRAENTFILAADGPINVTQFDSLLRRRDETRPEALEMLVLSACQTAAGDNRATLGLAGASLKAGARSTVASLWHVNDKSTAILIGEFYRELTKTKVTKAEALRKAQITLLTQYPNYTRPGFWAPYVLVGNWL